MSLAMANRLISAAALLAALAGCAWYRPAPQILVNTMPPGASCDLTQAGQQIATVGPTPAIALVAPSAEEIRILCRRSAFADATARCRRSQAGPDLALASAMTTAGPATSAASTS